LQHICLPPLRGYGPPFKGQQAAGLIVKGACPQSISLKAEFHALMKKKRMTRAPQVHADFSAPTRLARAIRVLSKALSSQASEHRFESKLDATSVVRLVGNIRYPSKIAARRICDHSAAT